MIPFGVLIGASTLTTHYRAGSDRPSAAEPIV